MKVILVFILFFVLYIAFIYQWIVFINNQARSNPMIAKFETPLVLLVPVVIALIAVYSFPFHLYK